MGRNFWSVCHQCEVKLMHFRGDESTYMQLFAREHSEHEKMTEVYNDYVEEPPERYAEDLRPSGRVRANKKLISKLAPPSPTQED